MTSIPCAINSSKPSTFRKSDCKLLKLFNSYIVKFFRLDTNSVDICDAIKV